MHAAPIRVDPSSPIDPTLPPRPAQPERSQTSQFPTARPYTSAGKCPIAVIGAGFSGTIATLQLLRRLPEDQPVLLCERASEFARGIAYSTGVNEHLLNVRAANMSAFPDDRDNFTDWLSRRFASAGDRSGEIEGTGEGGLDQTDAGLFASRGLYGQYLRSLLDEAMRQTAGHAQLRLLPDHIVDIEPSRAPGNLQGFSLACAGGRHLEVAGVVIAAGNLPAADTGQARICRDAWDAKAWQPLDPDRAILIVGTGLTMVDLAIGLRRRGFPGRIVAISRGGLLPARHLKAAAWPTPRLTGEEERSLSRLLARLRAEIAEAEGRGVDWRGVIDSLRPITAGLWGGLPEPDRRRFLRHLRRYWDVRRHRMAPSTADQIEAMRANGSLSVVAGRIGALDEAPDGVRVRYRPRVAAGTPRPEMATIEVQRVIMASGVEHVSRTGDRLMRNLLARGLVRSDAHGMGIDADAALHVIGESGAASPNLWALGPIVRGVFWECVAVPDIRLQAAQIADSVVEWSRREAAHWSFAI